MLLSCHNHHTHRHEYIITVLLEPANLRFDGNISIAIGEEGGRAEGPSCCGQISLFSWPPLSGGASERRFLVFFFLLLLFYFLLQLLLFKNIIILKKGRFNDDMTRSPQSILGFFKTIVNSRVVSSEFEIFLPPECPRPLPRPGPQRLRRPLAPHQSFLGRSGLTFRLYLTY